MNKEQKDELSQWQHTPAGKYVLAKSREEYQSNKRGNGKGKDINTPKKRKKWLTKFAKKPAGRAHTMAIMAKVNENGMEVDNVNGQIDAVDAWPSLKSLPGKGEDEAIPTYPIIPAGYYKPSELRK